MCKHPFHSFSPADSFSASCLKLYKMGHILGCPEGVWRVSWRCLGIIWVTLDTVWMGMLSAQLKKIILGHFNQLRHFLTVANFRRFRAQNAKFQVWFYIWRSPQIKKNPIETGLKIKFPVRIQMDRSYNWDRTSQWALLRMVLHGLSANFLDCEGNQGLVFSFLVVLLIPPDIVWDVCLWSLMVSQVISSSEGCNHQFCSAWRRQNGQKLVRSEVRLGGREGFLFPIQLLPIVPFIRRWALSQSLARWRPSIVVKWRPSIVII